MSNYSAIHLALSRTEDILRRSFGEVKKAETLDKKGAPAPDGLLCPKIFGVSQEYTCVCGKYREERSESGVCSRCGVELLSRQELGVRFGHIELGAPVLHPWFITSAAVLLDSTKEELEGVFSENLYWVVSAPPKAYLHTNELLTEERYQELLDRFGDALLVQTGPRAIQERLSQINIEERYLAIKGLFAQTTAKARREKLKRELTLLESLYQSRQEPRDMMLTVLPVMPAIYREEEESFDEETDPETGEVSLVKRPSLNSLYQRVINRNLRLKKLQELNAPNIITRNEVIVLAETIKDLFAGIRRTFAQNPVERSVDFSGHVAVGVDPSLSLSSCAIPIQMALTLWRPFLLQRLRDEGLASSLDEANWAIEEDPEALDLLGEEMASRPILLSGPHAQRSMLPLSPRLTQGELLLVHPLVAAHLSLPLNGEHASVHVLLSPRARRDAQERLGFAARMISPISHRPAWSLSKEALLGLFLLTAAAKHPTQKLFSSAAEALTAYELGAISHSEEITVRHQRQRHTTTAGRLLLVEIFPEVPFADLNKAQNQESIEVLLSGELSARALCQLEALGTSAATKFGASLCIEDLLAPQSKSEQLDRAGHMIYEVFEQYCEGLITDGERHNKSIDIWKAAQTTLVNEVKERIEHERGALWAYTCATREVLSPSLSAMIGLQDWSAQPVLASLREGIKDGTYFLAARRQRGVSLREIFRGEETKSLQEKILRVIGAEEITVKDCHTKRGLVLSKRGREPLHLTGRMLAKDTRKHKAPLRIDDEIARSLESSLDETISIRSPFACEAPTGVCAACYGEDRVPAKVGFFAACAFEFQEIKPMDEAQPFMQTSKSWVDGVVQFESATIVTNKANERRVISRYSHWYITKDSEPIFARMPLPYGAIVHVEHGDQISTAQEIVSWETGSAVILAEQAGEVRYQDIVEGLTCKEVLDELTGLSRRVITESALDLRPSICIQDPDHTKWPRKVLSSIHLPSGAVLSPFDGESVTPGDIIARLERPRAAHQEAPYRTLMDLIDATPPAISAQHAMFDGTISFGRDRHEANGIFRTLHLEAKTGERETYVIPRGQLILAQHNEQVQFAAKLCEGEVDPHELLRVFGVHYTASYLRGEILRAHQIPAQHVELLLGKMLGYVKILSAGDSLFEEGEIVLWRRWQEECDRLLHQTPPIAEPVLLGVSALGALQERGVLGLHTATPTQLAKMALRADKIPLTSIDR